MSRKRRIEYQGAVYHVISRGNYRADVFEGEGTRRAFLKCLGEAATKAGWVVHAWCVMSNHYHVCLETPSPNLVAGMRWLQATFSLRFNRLRNERGHVFQGRYKALPVEPDAIGAVCHYIHLNPVRAGVRTMASLADWPWTSMAWLMKPRERQRWYSPGECLVHAGGLKDTPAERRRYVEYLGWLHEDDEGRKALCFEGMSKGWAVGEREFKKELLRMNEDAAPALLQHGDRQLAEELWETQAAACLKATAKTKQAVDEDPKGASWKVAIAAVLKNTTTASNPWIARRLNMGSPYRVSRLVSHCRANPQEYTLFRKLTAKCKV